MQVVYVPPRNDPDALTIIWGKGTIANSYKTEMIEDQVPMFEYV